MASLEPMHQHEHMQLSRCLQNLHTLREHGIDIVYLLEYLNSLDLLGKVGEILNSKLLLPKLAVVLATFFFSLNDVVAAVFVIVSHCPVRVFCAMAEYIGFEPLDDAMSIPLIVKISHLTRPLENKLDIPVPKVVADAFEDRKVLHNTLDDCVDRLCCESGCLGIGQPINIVFQLGIPSKFQTPLLRLVTGPQHRSKVFLYSQELFLNLLPVVAVELPDLDLLN